MNTVAQPWEDDIWGQCGIGTQYRDLNGESSRIILGAMPPRSSHYDSCMPWVAFPPLEPQVSVQEQQPVCWPFKKAPGFLADFLFFQVNRVSTDFHCQMLCRLFLPGSGALGWGSWHGVETPNSSGGTFAAEISLQILIFPMWVWVSALCTSPLFLPDSI